MWAFVLTALAVAADLDTTGLIDEVVALSTPEARRARITEEMTATSDPGSLAQLSSALVVLAQLDATGRSDPTVIRMFLASATDPDPVVRAQAEAAARAGGDPPQLAAIPGSGPPSAGTLADAIRVYQRDHLYRDKLQYTVTTGYANYYAASLSTQNVFAWAIYDGGGHMLSTPEFFDRVGDSRGKRRYHAGMARRTSLGTTLTIAGTAALAVGMGAMFSAVSEDVPDSMLWVGTGVAVAGSVPFGVGIGQFVFNRRHKQFVYTEYEIDEADALVEDYNDDLLDQLGLQAADVTHIVP